MSRTLERLRSGPARLGFIVLTLAAASWSLVANRAQVGEALQMLRWPDLLAATFWAVAYVLATALAWRSALRAVGHDLSLRPAAHVFFVGQLGKYLPGGVWNVLAAAELGTLHKIARSVSVVAMMLAVLVSLSCGAAIGAIALVTAPVQLSTSYTAAVAFVGVVGAVLLVPPVLNRVLTLALRVTRQPALQAPVRGRGMLAVVLLSLVAWVFAGIHIWVLLHGVGAEGVSIGSAVAGYALAWTAGFLVIVSPAGLGAREGVLVLLLAPFADSGRVLVVALASRVLLTIVDLAAGLCAVAVHHHWRARDRRTAGNEDES